MSYSLLRVAASSAQRVSPWRSAASASTYFSTKAQETETFLSGSTSLYAEQMYEQYLENPDSVHGSWKQYFENLEQGVAYNAEDYSRPSMIPGKRAAAVVRFLVCPYSLGFLVLQ